jgi:hypothetical protein
MNRDARRELLVFGLLLAFGILGRWAQPAWNFTPLAAVAALGGYYFRNWLPAVLLPVAMLVASDTLLAPHDNWVAAASVYAMTLLPVAMGRATRRSEGWGRAAVWGLCGFVPATAFFLVTNFAVWASKSLYEPTLAGLGECFARALPFYRTMLAGDVCYVSLAVACLAAAQLLERPVAVARVQRRS